MSTGRGWTTAMRRRQALAAIGALLLVAGCGTAPPPAAPAAAEATSPDGLTPIGCRGTRDCVGRWTRPDGAVLTLQNYSNVAFNKIVMAVTSLPGLHSTQPVQIAGRERRALLYTRGTMTQLAIQDGSNLVVASIDRVLPEAEARAVLMPIAARAF